MGNIPASLVSHTVRASPVKVTLDDADTGAVDSFVGESAAGLGGGVFVGRSVCCLSTAFFTIAFFTVLFVSTAASTSGTSALISGAGAGAINSVSWPLSIFDVVSSVEEAPQNTAANIAPTTAKPLAHSLFLLRPAGGQDPMSSSELSSTAGWPGMKKVREPGSSGADANEPTQGGGSDLFRSVPPEGATRPDVLRPVPMDPGWPGSGSTKCRDGRPVGSSG
jgi:hypothetical protein